LFIKHLAASLSYREQVGASKCPPATDGDRRRHELIGLPKERCYSARHFNRGFRGALSRARRRKTDNLEETMHYRLLTAVLALDVAMAGTALAQPRPITRPVRPVVVQPQPQQQPQPVQPAQPYVNPTPTPQNNAAVCGTRHNIADSEQKRLESYQSQLVGIDAEMAQLTRRLDDLRRQREDVKRNADDASLRYTSAQQAYARDCSAMENCGSYEAQARALDSQSDAVERDLSAVRTEVQTNRSAIGQLEGRIAPLQQEYAGRRCNNLVPGETDQNTIDRCTMVFTDWNRLQAELNRQNTRVPELKSRYEQLLSTYRSLEGRANGYSQYLARNCAMSPETSRMQSVGVRRQQAQGVGQELDSLIGDLSRLRGVKITSAPQPGAQPYQPQPYQPQPYQPQPYNP
jgi:hypothetical protein